jgi:hypothetical protein
MPAKYEKMGIAFQYPENWTLDEQDAVAGTPSVTVLSPGGGFWTVAVHPRSADPVRMAEAAVSAMREEYEGLEVQPAQETLADHELQGFDLNFFYLDLTNTARIRTIRLRDATYSVFYQAEDGEFERVERVFSAMTASLLQGTARSVS